MPETWEGHDTQPVMEAELQNDTETIEKAGVKTAKENLLELIELQASAGDLERPKQDTTSNTGASGSYRPVRRGQPETS
jgi:hypothetical protein